MASAFLFCIRYVATNIMNTIQPLTLPFLFGRMNAGGGTRGAGRLGEIPYSLHPVSSFRKTSLIMLI